LAALETARLLLPTSSVASGSFLRRKEKLGSRQKLGASQPGGFTSRQEKLGASRPQSNYPLILPSDVVGRISELATSI